MGAIVPIGERRHALGFELLVEVGHHRAGRHLAGAGIVAHQERQVEDVEFLDAERPELGDRGGEELHRAELQRLQLLLVLVERGVRIDLHLHPTIGVFLGEILEHHGGLALGSVGRHHVAEFDDDRLLGLGAAGERETAGRDCGGCNCRHELDVHGRSLRHLCAGPGLIPSPGRRCRQYCRLFRSHPRRNSPIGPAAPGRTRTHLVDAGLRWRAGGSSRPARPWLRSMAVCSR